MDTSKDVIDFDDKSELSGLPESKLLLAMLYQAIEDALYSPKKVKTNATECSVNSLKSKNKAGAKDKIDAIEWLFDDNDVYDLCCELAGISKHNIRDMIIDKLGAENILPLVHEFYQPNGH
jgi:hypothetical protein